ncbi:MAG: MORN repeat-containing protein [Bacteroidia bacterium]|nr:MORN repeat-containing protein [Bacteroidia bacterium]
MKLKGFFILLFGMVFSLSFAQYGKRCISGNCENGYGVLDYGANTGKYEGEFRNGKREGAGTMYYADGRKWEGVWKKDAFKGGTTTHIPYHPLTDSVRPAGISDANPFNDALYRVLSTVSDNFRALKGEKTGTEVNGKYAIWKPVVMIPQAKYGVIRQETNECRYYFLEGAGKEEADKKFEEISRLVQFANPKTWSFKDISSNPAFPYHRKLYKWTIATPATIRLELRQSPAFAGKYDLFMVFTQ